MSQLRQAEATKIQIVVPGRTDYTVGKKVRVKLIGFDRGKAKLTIKNVDDEVSTPKEQRADKEVVLIAVRQYGFVLQSASEGLRADRELVLTAIIGRGPPAKKK